LENTGVRDRRETAVGKLGKEKDVGGYIQASAFGRTCDSYNLFSQISIIQLIRYILKGA